MENLETNSAVAGGGPGIINTDPAETDVSIGYSRTEYFFRRFLIDEVKIWSTNRTHAQIAGYKDCEITTHEIYRPIINLTSVQLQE